jgi:DNA-binding response OmpR family regulator
MPGVNGLVLARRLSMARPGIRVLLMSGYTDEEILRRGLREPGTAYLQKPFTPAVIANKVRAVLDEDGDAHNTSAIA